RLQRWRARRPGRERRPGGSRAGAQAGSRKIQSRPRRQRRRAYFGLHASGRPQAFSVPYQFEIVASSHHLAILYGYPGTFRTIPTDGGAHPPDPAPTWRGDSIGHWEGDTLVVDTVGFNDKPEINGYRHSETLHMVERFRRSDYNTLQYEATLEDPNVFVRPWTVTRSFALRPDLSKVDEFVCEHNTDYSKYFEKK